MLLSHHGATAADVGHADGAFRGFLSETAHCDVVVYVQ